MIYCSNTCPYASDAECDDGGSGSEYPDCHYGTDCTDCGPRMALPRLVPPNVCNDASTTPFALFGQPATCNALQPYCGNFAVSCSVASTCPLTCGACSSHEFCDDSVRSSQQILLNGQPATCSDLAPFCNHVQHGFLIRSLCGETCGCGFCPPPYPSPPPSPPLAPACSNGLPVDLVLVLDHSGSMRVWQAAVLEWVRELILQFDFGESAARVGLVEFNQQAIILSNLTQNAGSALAALANAQVGRASLSAC